MEWPADVVAHSVSARGLVAALAFEGAEPGQADGCAAMMEEAVEPLLRRAVREGAVAADVTVADLVTLVVGAVLATERHPDPVAAADRMFRLAVAGIGPPGGRWSGARWSVLGDQVLGGGVRSAAVYRSVRRWTVLPDEPRSPSPRCRSSSPRPDRSTSTRSRRAVAPGMRTSSGQV